MYGMKTEDGQKEERRQTEVRKKMDGVKKRQTERRWMKRR